MLHPNQILHSSKFHNWKTNFANKQKMFLLKLLFSKGVRCVVRDKTEPPKCHTLKLSWTFTLENYWVLQWCVFCLCLSHLFQSVMRWFRMTELGEKSWDLSLYELHRYIHEKLKSLTNLSLTLTRSRSNQNLTFDIPAHNIKTFGSGRHRRR